MSDQFSFDVFLSHSSRDKNTVREIAARLQNDGLKVWFDEWLIRPGDSIPSKVEQGLENSRVLVLCMSANALGSEWAELETGTFRFRDPLNKNRRFITLRLDDTPPKDSLKQFLYIKWNAATCEQEYCKLLDACMNKPGFDVDDYENWDPYSTARPFSDRIRLIEGSQFSTRPYVELRSLSRENVGMNRDLVCLSGQICVEYLAVSSAPSTDERSNLSFRMIPMAGEAGARPYKELYCDSSSVDELDQCDLILGKPNWYFVPQVHVGDGNWHKAYFQFDFQELQDASYSIFAPRIMKDALPPALDNCLSVTSRRANCILIHTTVRA
jgi:hypothetical protein